MGALVARHLVSEHGARHVLLLASGGAVPTQAEVRSELEAALRELGCEVRIVACDVATRPQLEELLDTVPAEHPVCMVVHTAGCTEDGLIESLDGERLSRAMVAKVDGAIHLHELCRAAELILFSSAAAVIGNAGQGGSAAANAFLDALAHSRRAARPARGVGGLGDVGAVGRTLAERGVCSQPASPAPGSSAALGRAGTRAVRPCSWRDQSLLLPARLGSATLRTAPRRGRCRRCWEAWFALCASGMKRGGRWPDACRSARSGVGGDRCGARQGSRRGRAWPWLTAALDLERPFKEAGFDSLAALEIKNRLSHATGLKLPATLVFDHPTPACDGRVSARRSVRRRRAGRPTIDEEIDRLERMLAASADDGAERERSVGVCARCWRNWTEDAAREATSVTADEIQSASAEELVELIERDLSESS